VVSSNPPVLEFSNLSGERVEGREFFAEGTDVVFFESASLTLMLLRLGVKVP